MVEQGGTTDPWLPVNFVQPQQAPLYENPWLPQVPANLPRDTWAPIEIEQTQQRIPWFEQRPQTNSCTFRYDGVPSEYIHPFLVDTERQELIYPDIVRRQQIVTLTSGTTVLASCPGSGNYLARNKQPRVYITCRNSQLYRGRNPVSWADLGCHKKIKPTLKSGESCGKDSRMHFIGWDIRRGLYLPQISVCFNRKLETSVFVTHTIHGRFIDAKVVEPSRPSFKSNRMFSVSLNRQYKKAKQRELASQYLRSMDELSGKGQHYLAKGHLAPDADFVLEAEQDATYYYINVVPQWQAVNNGNWKSLESAVRELAEERQATLEVYTGTHGILELPDVNSHPTTMFLGGKVVPVPALMWKVIHDPAANTAVAIVVINDVKERPSSGSWRSRHPPCSTVCSDLGWVDWEVDDVTEGRTFCCTVDDLRQTIPHLPRLSGVNLFV